MKKTASLLLALVLLLAILAPAALAADDITVYVSVADNGAAAIGEKSGQPMIAVPITAAPSLAKRRRAAAPSPCPAPVSKTTFPSNLPI